MLQKTIILISALFLFSNNGSSQTNVEDSFLPIYLCETSENEYFYAKIDGKYGIYDSAKSTFAVQPEFDFLEISFENEIIIGFSGESMQLTVFNFSSCDLHQKSDSTLRTSGSKIEIYSDFRLKERSLSEFGFLVIESDTTLITSGYNTKSSLLDVYSDKKTYDTSKIAVFKKAQIFSLEVINDSLLIFLDYRNEGIHPSKIGLRSKLYPDEDSIFNIQYTNHFERKVSTDGFSEYGESGIYDFKNKQWFIPNHCKRIELIDGTFYYEERQAACFKPQYVLRAKGLNTN